MVETTADAATGDLPIAAAPVIAGDEQIVAVYQTNNSAHLARDALVAAGFPKTAIHLFDRADQHLVGEKSSPNEKRAWMLQSLGSLFSRAEHAPDLRLAHDPLHAILVLGQSGTLDRTRAQQILQATGPVEMYTGH